MLVVIDTNILVSALWSRNGIPAQFLSMVLRGRITPCYDYRILEEYREVLSRDKFEFSEGEVAALLDFIRHAGYSVVADLLPIPFLHEDDKKFFEVAVACDAKLITGNIRHYPEDERVMTVKEFLDKWTGA